MERAAHRQLIALCVGLASVAAGVSVSVSVAFAAPLDVALIEGTRGSESASPFASPPAAANPWSVGIRSGYATIPNGILGALYDHYMPVNGYFVEAVVGRKWKGLTIYTGLTVTHLGADHGIWQRSALKTPNGLDIDVTMLSAEALFDWEVRLHKRFAFHFGAGIGLGGLFGSVSSKDCTSVNFITGQCTTSPNEPTKDKLADGWPVYPVLHLTIGVHIDLIEKLALRVDFDFRNAFGFGLGLFYTL